LGIGANLPSDAGAPKATIRAALAVLGDANLEVLQVSRLFRSPAFPAGSGPDYVNAAVACHTDLGAGDILPVLHRVERDFGRSRLVRWGARPLDIDLLAVGARICPDRAGYDAWAALGIDEQMRRAPEQLILPHPRLHQRAFVLIPLADIAPTWRHPVIGQTVLKMLAALPKSDLAAITPLESA
jgi:2-amino-4-hydroxy-6-hydroxymethyldihydropteridine diphosphokinase